MSGHYARVTAGKPQPAYIPALRDRVNVNRREHGTEGDDLDGWIVDTAEGHVTISSSPDDDGRADYDRDTHMRAMFPRDRYTTITLIRRSP